MISSIISLSNVPVSLCAHHHCVYIRISTYLLTPLGAYLLSVGIEGVLVLWQVDTQQNHFRPRLGGAITSVSVSPRDEWIALGMQNNGKPLHRTNWMYSENMMLAYIQCTQPCTNMHMHTHTHTAHTHVHAHCFYHLFPTLSRAVLSSSALLSYQSPLST